MAYNKIVYGGRVLIDLTADTVSPSTLSKGATAHDSSGKAITGTNDYDVNSEDATVKVAEMLDGKTAYARGAKLTGTMPNNGAVTGTLYRKDDAYTIPQGYHDGSGTVGISSTEQAKIIPANIRQGVTILGVGGTMTGTEDEKKQEKTITPTTSDQIILPDDGYTCLTQILVKAIPYVEAPNSAGGTTVTIG